MSKSKGITFGHEICDFPTQGAVSFRPGAVEIDRGLSKKMFSDNKKSPNRLEEGVLHVGKLSVVDDSEKPP